MERMIRHWLARDPPSLELATLAYDELVYRHQDLQAGMAFSDAGLEPIPWLQAARSAVADAFRLDRPTVERRRANVYVILRGGYTRQNGWYGVYVGSTARPVEERYLQHRQGIRAAHGLPLHGIELLYSLFDRINPVPARKEERLTCETRLHEALAPVVPKVTGDVAF